MYANNQINIIGEINYELYEKCLNAARDLKNPATKKVSFIINSPGGELYAAFAILDMIDEFKAKGFDVITLVSGRAHSAASLVSSSGTKRFITKNSTLLIHKVRESYNYMDTKELKTHLDNLLRDEKVFERIYSENSKGMVKYGRINEKIFTAEDALKYNLVDEIV